MTQLKGVNKTVVEIANPNSEYFERVVCYLKPNLSRNDRAAIRSETHALLAQLSPRTPAQIGKTLLLRAVILAVGAASGALLTLLWLK